LHNPSLLARRERFPHRIEYRHGLGDLTLVNQLVAQCDYLLANFSRTAFRDPNPFLKIGRKFSITP
jgi:hypothetical protein